jgi:hypothetical protein
MPYIITTEQPATPGPVGLDTDFSRYAVATLAGLNALCIEHGATGLTTGELRRLVNKGGTIGPLPDETTIEVTLVSMNWIIGVAEDRGAKFDEDVADIDIFNTFNEQETA